MSEPILTAENLIKNFGRYRAVDGISFSVPRGKVVGFLGPNGAGKTTTIHMLLGITLKNGGKIHYFGKDFDRHRSASLQKINFASAYSNLQNRLTVSENLAVFANLYSVKNYAKKIKELLEYFQIPDLADKKFQDLSSGQKTRVMLVKALLNDPELLLLDEPTASLDPDIADKTLSLIEDLKKSRGLSILYTSHNMDEVTRICDEVIFLNNGRIVAQDTPVGLTKRIPKVYLRLTFDAEPSFVKGYLLAHKQQFEMESNWVVVVKTQEEMVARLIAGMQKSGIAITDIDVNKPTLEDVFLEIARGGSNVVA